MHGLGSLRSGRSGPRRAHTQRPKASRRSLLLSVGPAASIAVRSAPEEVQAAESSASAASKITELLDNNRDQSFYDLNAQLKPAVADLIERNPSTKPGPESFVFGQGEWRVFHAPHIVQLSGALGARFDPIVYRLDGQKIVSNVRYKHPLLGSGWLSASGDMKPKGDDKLELHFDRFWVDLGDKLRPELPAADAPADGASAAGGTSGSDWISAIGRAAFFPQFAIFPVMYLDADVAVFQFTPLSSNIAVRRVQRSALPA